MNTYPILPTRVAPDDPNYTILVDEAPGGSIRTRHLSTRPRKIFKLVHPNLTAAQKATLEDFWAAQVGPFYYTRTRETVETYTVLFISAPVATYERGGYYTMTVTLREA